MEDPHPAPEHEVVVIGAGFSGIGAAIGLAKAGIDDFIIVEDGDGVGGAWHWNTYPGVAVDIPSFSYQFSYEQSSGWSRVYAPGNELKDYAEHCVSRYGLADRLRLNTRVTGAEFDDERHLWRLDTENGETITARHVIGATGILTKPKPPAIAGVEDFEGVTVHTARWEHSLELHGKRVAVIGTGASAVQLVPTIAPEVRSLAVFQRTPIWCLPKPDAPMPGAARGLLRFVPGASWALRAISQAYVELTFTLVANFSRQFPLAKLGEAGHRHLREQVEDPRVREQLTPGYSLGCKRPGFSNDYLATFNRPNVQLHTTPIERITPEGVETSDGVVHEIDVLVLATGFKVFEAGNLPPFPVRGSEGLDLDEFWRENRFQAYQGVSVPRFPNYFTILGPYGFNGASYFTLIENQTRHIVRALSHARREGATRVEATAEANARYFAKMLGRRRNQVFFQGGCGTANSYYFDVHGDAPFRASTTPEVMWTSARYDLADYSFQSLGA